MSRQFIALDSSLATKIIPHRPEFITPEFFLLGVIRSTHWLIHTTYSELDKFHYFNDRLPYWFLTKHQLSDCILGDAQAWEDNLSELMLAVQTAVGNAMDELVPVLDTISTHHRFSYIARDGVGIYLEVDND